VPLCRNNLELRDSEGSEEMVAGFKKVCFTINKNKIKKGSFLFLMSTLENELKRVKHFCINYSASNVFRGLGVEFRIVYVALVLRSKC
jgi:hypothetical protein